MTDSTKEFDFGVLDVSIDDIEDLPSFDCPPDGTYQLLVNAEPKVFEGKDGKPDTQSISFQYEITDTIELADKTAKAPAPGSKFNELFGLNNEDGIKYLKKAVLPYATHFGTTNMRELVAEKIQNVVITATLKARSPSKDKDGNKIDPADRKRYASVINVNIQ